MISLVHQRLKSTVGNPQYTEAEILFPYEGWKGIVGTYCRSLEAVPTHARSSVP